MNIFVQNFSQFTVHTYHSCFFKKFQPSWTLYIQVMSFKQAENFKWNPFDLTKVSVCVCVCVCVVCVSVCVVCVCLCVCVCACAHACVCLYLYCLCMCVCMHAHDLIHTYFLVYLYY